jgi:hypothetical protein
LVRNQRFDARDYGLDIGDVEITLGRIIGVERDRHIKLFFDGENTFNKAK